MPDQLRFVICNIRLMLYFQGCVNNLVHFTAFASHNYGQYTFKKKNVYVFEE